MSVISPSSDQASAIATFAVRRASAAELPACAALYERVLRETFTWLPPHVHRAQDFLDHARDEEVWLAAHGDRILGVASYYRPAEFLHSLYVEARGQGVGKALLDQVMASATGPFSLKVQAENLRAQAFYVREGFLVVERGDAGPGKPAWLRMARSAD
ncbi:GNAT family N-acetyltransferase [Phenylobacterium sp.]|uniref:GNAT family N-acetyltransferase n=1 Tax=Phenylobacterium sp. TaxID=1871053 RepID=UPI002733D198|nr:GNAT family N-acetyltransferase [Phenylobacterium sp.]MDP3659720.1 GNAT family N-acetyltransferase [Phenylobacterium sp.]